MIDEMAGHALKLLAKHSLCWRPIATNSILFGDPVQATFRIPFQTSRSSTFSLKKTRNWSIRQEVTQPQRVPKANVHWLHAHSPLSKQERALLTARTAVPV